MADKYKIDGVPPQNKIVNSLDKIELWRGRLNVPYAIASEALGIAINDAKQAAAIEDAAQNVSAPIDQFSQVIGAMRILGTEKIAAIKSTEQLYSTLNNMLWDRNEQGMAQLNNFGYDIISNKNGTADVPATLTNIARDFPQMAPKAQSKVIEALGGEESGAIELLREGVRLNDLLAKSTHYGLTIDPELNTQLTQLNRQINELGGAWEGLKQKVSNAGDRMLVSDGSVADGIGGLTDLLTYGVDNFAILRSFGVISGNDSEKMRWAYNEPDFNQKLNWYETMMLNSGLMTDGFRKKYQVYHESKNAEKVNYQAQDIGIIPALRPVKMEPNPLTDIFSLGPVAEVNSKISTQNTWRNNRVTDPNAPDPYSLWSPSAISLAGVDASGVSVNASPIDTESTGGVNLGAIADVIATAMQNNRVQIELTLIDGRTGETSVIPAQGGGRISYAMAMPM
ncbi:hypothetical protein [Yersinia mollaretii]|uniref:Bacteriophage coat protein n=1 Tax=Yersinia mollaretii TaxID=33060 RepID=A0AA36LJP0_YERMO|nr:hypothetical protein [Yersinia mollaretii]CNH59763.1 putative bacteriophage coat protein [Yersinia mollaretii]